MLSNCCLIVLDHIDNGQCGKQPFSTRQSCIYVYVQEFKKYAAVYYMPIFTLNELEATREWFPDVTQDRMLELYGKWGGSTHWVLQRGGPEDSEFNAAQLREAISSTSVEMLRRAFLGDATAQVCFSLSKAYRDWPKDQE